MNFSLQGAGRRATWSFLVLAGIASAVVQASAAVDPFAENIRPTGPTEPGKEAESFHLPPGFEIQLVANEPEIGKPFNIAFDARGRLWMTTSEAYPFPDKSGGNPKDRILILEDFDDHGHARKVTAFAEGLNIPIGVYPYKDGCIAYSIPNIIFFHDTDGDGKADKQEILCGPFSFDRDTHGMASNFRRGFDGYLYGCHGFNNISTVKAQDGSTITMNSGNTWRLKIDQPGKSHIEQFTWGQTNPFGLCFDAWGNLYSSDSHSKPVYQLIRGGFYEGIGKKDDGLGLAPTMMTHAHNSTAIASCLFYDADQWPAEYRGNTFNGNVVTSRINRDSISYKGSTPVAKEEPDFLTTTDPWFRPVQLQLGPDGAMWVADFYNKIIGHYEVPLTHPGRDHTHGRIWRIVYKGTDGKLAPPPWRGDLTKANAADLIETLRSPNLTLRMLATDQVSDRLGVAAVEPLNAQLDGKPTPTQAIHALWALFRVGHPGATERRAVQGSKHPEAMVRAHAMRVFAELGESFSDTDSAPLKALQDGDPVVRRAAADALGRHPRAEYLRPLIDLHEHTPAEDTHLQYQLKVALRETLKRLGSFDTLTDLDPKQRALLARISLGVPTEASGKFAAAYLANAKLEPQATGPFLKHAIRYAPETDVEALVTAAQSRLPDDPDQQLPIAMAVQSGAAERGIRLGDATRAWEGTLAGRLLDQPGANAKATAARQQAGAELARTLKRADLTPALLKVAVTRGGDPAARIAAAKAALGVDPKADIAPLASIVAASTEPPQLREGFIDAIVSLKTPAAFAAVVEAVRQAPERIQTRAARAMALSPESADVLLAAVAAGKISPRVLNALGVREGMIGAKVPDAEARITALTKNVPPLAVEIQSLIDARRAGYGKAKHDASAGAELFTRTCAVCHAIDGKGAVIGPQLDGIGNRGLDRLLEDVLDPNRAVDPAFHQWNVKLKDGSDVSGLIRREEGQTLVLVDGAGAEMVLKKADVKEKKESTLSPMPANFGEVLSDAEFYSLMAYLLSKNAAK